MTSRQRFQNTLNHKPVDRVCVDFGATVVTGIAATAVDKLRKAVLGQNDYRVKVVEPYQMLAEIDPQLREALGIDMVGLALPKTMFGFENSDWKEFTLFDGTEVLVPGNFNVTKDDDGNLLIYPQGDTSVPPSGRMPKDGFYFDAICRQEPIVESELNPADNTEDFELLSVTDLNFFKRESQRLAESDLGVIITVPGTAFGDIAMVPATWMKQTKGIRDVEEWYISTAARRDYVYKVFEYQCDIALKNLKNIINVVGDRVQAAFVTGTDFGTQRGPFISLKAYRDLFKPFHKAVNDFIHKNSNWKTFMHSCGSVVEMIPEFIDAGFDILNPVQCSAVGMDPKKLKDDFGNDIVFWGGGVDTQKSLPFGSPKEVYNEVRQRIDIFNKNGGFVFNAIHNIQANSPVENILAMFDAIKDSYK